MTSPDVPEPDSGFIDVTLPDPPPEPAESPVGPPPGPQGLSTWAWGRWRYSGPAGRVYTIVPVTPDPGDVIEFWGPLDEWWTAVVDEPTRWPDNWRPDLPPAPLDDAPPDDGD